MTILRKNTNTAVNFFRLDCLDCHKKPVDQFRFSAVSATYVLITTFNYVFKRIFLKLDQSPKASETSCYLWRAVGTDMTDDGERIKLTRKNWKVIASIYARKLSWTSGQTAATATITTSSTTSSVGPTPYPFIYHCSFFFTEKVPFAYFLLDCKTVGFFLSPVSLSVFSLVPDLLFDCSRVLEYAKIRTIMQSNFQNFAF